MQKKIVTLFVVLFALLMLTSLNSSVGSSAPIANDKLIDKRALAIISDVYGIDLSKYQVIVNASGIVTTGTKIFGPGVTYECADITLVNSESIIFVNFNFANGYPYFSELDNIKGRPIYQLSFSTNVINQTKNILSKYQTFAIQNYACDTSYISTAGNMLNQISELQNITLTSAEAKMEIKSTDETSHGSGNHTDCRQRSTITYYFSAGSIDYKRKGFFLEFINGSLDFFTDDWGLISIGAPNALSRQEALDMAWAAATDLKLSFVSQNGSIFEEKSDLTNATSDIHLSYTLEKDSTALRPLWFVYFYFSHSINGDSGILVTIWGDTKEIYNCQALTTLGTVDTMPTILPSVSNMGTPIPNSVLWLILTGIEFSIVAAILIVWKKRTSND